MKWSCFKLCVHIKINTYCSSCTDPYLSLSLSLTHTHTHTVSQVATKSVAVSSKGSHKIWTQLKVFVFNYLKTVRTREKLYWAQNMCNICLYNFLLRTIFLLQYLARFTKDVHRNAHRLVCIHVCYYLTSSKTGICWQYYMSCYMWTNIRTHWCTWGKTNMRDAIWNFSEVKGLSWIDMGHKWPVN